MEAVSKVLCVSALVGLASAALSTTPDFQPFMSMDNGTADGMERWGYADIREGAHLFSWLYKTYHTDGYLNRPWVIWLQGGPGGSSCGYGNFELIGPLDLDLNTRQESWVNSSTVLFLDQPVGTGYSYVDAPEYYATTNPQVAQDMLSWVKLFLTNYPEFQTLPLYVFGQSYGGKMGSEFAYELQMAINRGEVVADLRGAASGNAWISPEDSVMAWAPHLYYMGNLDDRGYTAVMDSAVATQDAIIAEDWLEATRLWGLTENIIWAHTNMIDFYNILKYVGSLLEYNPQKYHVPDSKKDKTINIDPVLYNIHLAPFELRDLDDLMNGVIKDKLGIIPPGVSWGGQSDDVFDYMEGDFMKPVIHILDQLLTETDVEVIIYEGTLDLICLTKGAMDFVNKMTWSGIPAYQAAVKDAHNDPAYSHAQTELFVKAYNNFKYYWFINAGHSSAKDQPPTAKRMMERIVFDIDR